MSSSRLMMNALELPLKGTYCNKKIHTIFQNGLFNIFFITTVKLKYKRFWS